MAEASAVDRQRLDKWLWHARFARTRTTAQAVVRSGKVRVNREKTDSSSRPVKVGDVLTIAIGEEVRVLRIVAFADKRGGAEAARRLYEDLTPKAESVAAAPQTPFVDPGPRPNKHDRRDRRALKQQGQAGDDRTYPEGE